MKSKNLKTRRSRKSLKTRRRRKSLKTRRSLKSLKSRKSRRSRKTGKNKPKNTQLYKKVISEAKKKFKVWPSAYASAWVVKEYKRRGGSYSGKKSQKSGISRWMAEKWINVCKLPKKVACGRPKLSEKNWKKRYPYCRPSKKITSKTPRLASTLSKSQIKKLCKSKRKSPMRKVRIKKS